MDTSRYMAELQALKTVLQAAAAEQEALEKRVAEVRCICSAMQRGMREMQGPCICFC